MGRELPSDIKVELIKDASIPIRTGVDNVRRTNGRLVWQRVAKVKQAGASKIRWNLRDSKGRKVKAGRYVFTITATDASGAKVVVKKTVRVR